MTTTFSRLSDGFKPNRVVSPVVAITFLCAEAALLVGWWSCCTSEIVPRPWELVSALHDLWLYEGLGVELFRSFQVNVEALAIAGALSMGLAYLTVLPAVRPLAGFVSKLRFLGLVGLTLLFTLMTGGGHWLKVLTLAFGMTVFWVTSMADDVANTPREEYDHARTLRMGEWRCVYEVVILGQADRAFEILRQNAAVGWMMLTMVEGLVRSEGGVGAMLLNQNKHLHLANVFAIQASILVVGLGWDYTIGLAKQTVCPWASLGKQR